ncbi:MAG TPA: polyprenyl synthetase family protein, partial [Pyrinomonadaceae bacterium]|jgi:octaprenyl-diphosphate synthase
MTEGEILQLTTLGRSDVTEEQYFDILMRKTAYLFSACGEIGAMLGSKDAETQLALRNYGMNLGAAFQLVDDLLDFTATDDVLGKAAGVDLLEGKLTLPLIYLLETERDRRADVQTVMSEGTYDAISRASLTRAAEQSGALERARRRANDFAAAARNSLDVLPATKYRDALSSIPTFILERDR